MNSTTLADLGERRIVREILPKYCNLAGDDCAAFKAESNLLVVTTDPVPEPAAKLLGRDPDLYWMGWLLVTINCSDIAAAGAVPLTFVAAIEAPASLSVVDFERLLLGIKDACAEYGASYAGGNLRESVKITATGTAIGQCATGKDLRRSGLNAGDVIVSVGQGGVFWRDVLTVRAGHEVSDKLRSPLFRPCAQVRAMSDLHAIRAFSAAIDNSDGLLASVEQLAIASQVAIELDLQSLRDCESCPGDAAGDAARMWLGWGDWNVIAGVPENRLDEALTLARERGYALIPIGSVAAGSCGVSLRGGRETMPAPRIESERFAKDSWFATGIDSYVQLLLSAPLPE